MNEIAGKKNLPNLRSCNFANFPGSLFPSLCHDSWRDKVRLQSDSPGTKICLHRDAAPPFSRQLFWSNFRTNIYNIYPRAATQLFTIICDTDLVCVSAEHTRRVHIHTHSAVNGGKNRASRSKLLIGASRTRYYTGDYIHNNYWSRKCSRRTPSPHDARLCEDKSLGGFQGSYPFGGEYPTKTTWITSNGCAMKYARQPAEHNYPRNLRSRAHHRDLHTFIHTSVYQHCITYGPPIPFEMLVGAWYCVM